ncbi:MAG: alpha/beta hydrolase [Dehalococcoidia bacterium]
MPHASADGAQLYYEVHGSGDPLLMIPGFGSTTLVYFANIAPLAERFKVIVFDPRGSGRSDVPSSGYSMQGFVDDCVSVLSAAGEASAHVAAASFGGMVAQNLALTYPERVRRLVLICTTPGGPHHVSPPPEQMAVFLAAADIPDPAAAARSTYPLHYGDAYIAEHDAAIVERSLANAHLRSKLEGRIGQLTAVSQHDTLDRLPKLSTATLILHGQHDGIVPVENSRKMAAAIPNARIKIYPDAKHIVFTECADELNRDIIEFLTENER